MSNSSSLPRKAILVLEQGVCFEGYAFAAEGMRVGEVIFNTSMTGYQEILTDPSYYQQIVVLTYPHIGNTGVNKEDLESEKIWCSGLVVKDLPQTHSNWRSKYSLSTWMQQQNSLGISGIDTRELTNILRNEGAQKGCLMVDRQPSYAKALKAAQSFSGLVKADLAKRVTTATAYEWCQGSWQIGQGYAQYADDFFKATIAVYDFGVKKNMLRLLVDRGYRLRVFPATTPASEVLSIQPDGVLLSNGPGDPYACDYALESIRLLLQAKLPMLGICLGHQLLALASGAKTYKMKFGHHGANHPVRDQQGRVSISSQNHGFAVAEEDLPDCLSITHRSLFDSSIQGIAHKTSPAIGFQGHPEASPGPTDLFHLLDQFDRLIQQHKTSKEQLLLA